MATIVLIGRLLLSAIFLAAGVPKVTDRKGSRQSFIDFDIPEKLAGLFGTLLPLAELTVAIALWSASFAWIGAIGALALLSIFILAIAVTLARGRKPDCHCFGQLHSKPIGWDLAARNAALAIVAGLIIYAGPRQPSFRSWGGAYGGNSMLVFLVLAALGMLVIQSFLIYQLVQQGGRILVRLEKLETGQKPQDAVPSPPQGLPVGEPAPDFTLDDLDGVPATLERHRDSAKPTLMLFTNPVCGPCTALLPEIATWQREAAQHFKLLVISQGARKDNVEKLSQYALETVLVQHGSEVTEAYQATGTPSAVVVRPNGTIGSAVATGAEAIRALVSNTINESLASLVSIQLQPGESAPPLVYPDLDGKMFNLTQLRGKPSVLLFWNPGCGFCQQMTEDVKQWEKTAAKGGIQTLVISTGGVEPNRKFGFKSRIVLDANFSAGKAFGAGGTPSAVLLDANAKLASKVAVGKPDILETVFAQAQLTSS